MLEVIEKLLILQDRDRKISQVETELNQVGPERAALQARLQSAQSELESLRHRAMQIETDRKELELEVEAKKTQIEKYAHQQFQTKKNEEYRALAKEIDGCRAVIARLEDAQIELMEKAESTQKDLAAAARGADEIKKQIEAQLNDLSTKEANLAGQLTELQADHGSLGSAVEPGILTRYERLRRQKGATSVVGLSHGVCGGCHMQLPTHVVHAAKAERELVSCPNCSRILYYSPE